MLSFLILHFKQWHIWRCLLGQFQHLFSTQRKAVWDGKGPLRFNYLSILPFAREKIYLVFCYVLPTKNSCSECAFCFWETSIFLNEVILLLLFPLLSLSSVFLSCVHRCIPWKVKIEQLYYFKKELNVLVPQFIPNITEPLEVSCLALKSFSLIF